MKFAIDREELAKALCDRFPLGVPYTAYREDADAIIAALERAPQAQEERPSPWTPPKKDCDLCRGTGFYGDRGPGRTGNSEFIRCECTTRAQEEPIGGPATGVSEGAKRAVSEVARSLEAICKVADPIIAKYQPPAPASPAGPRTHSAGVLECLGYAMSIIEMTASALKAPASEGGMPNSPLLPQLRHAYESLKAARDFPDLAPAAPKAGAPGTQTPNQGEK